MLSANIKLTVNKDGPVPVRDQLIEQIALQIASGALRTRDKLPSIRQLAQKLGIHHSTVTSAYNHLAEVGLLDVRQGSGVRVASKGAAPEIDDETADLDELFEGFLARAAESEFSREQVLKCIQKLQNKRPVKQILIVDRNKDFHKLILAELESHFDLPVKAMTIEEFRAQPELIEDSFVLTSLYHLFPLKQLKLDPTRFFVCNVEPGRAEMDVIANLPASSILLLVSVSPTLLKMATTVTAALRGDEIVCKTVLMDEPKEIEYSMRYAQAIICDRPSQELIKNMKPKAPVRVFNLYSESTVSAIQERLKRWG